MYLYLEASKFAYEQTVKQTYYKNMESFLEKWADKLVDNGWSESTMVHKYGGKMVENMAFQSGSKGFVNLGSHSTVIFYTEKRIQLTFLTFKWKTKGVQNSSLRFYSMLSFENPHSFPILIHGQVLLSKVHYD